MAWQMDEVASKWQQRWWDAKIHEAERDEQKPSFFIHFAYPGISGYLHVGHMRGFTYTDVFTRYKKQTGFNTVFPAGFHASGIPAVAFAKEVERGEKTEYLRSNGYDGDIQALADPQAVVDYFAEVYTYDYWKKFGFLIDERRNCTTIDEGYQRFIEWQFRRLNDKGYLIQKPHYAPFCPVAGPVAVDKSETDIKQGGAADINEFVALRFRAQLADGTDVILPCATLRPETIYGVTNLWAHPEHEYELVSVWKDGAVEDTDESEIWVVSKQGRIKLEWQMERAEGLDKTVPGAELVGLDAIAPITRAAVPVVQGTFVNPDIATGVVMSVPGHAPFDWAAYNDAGLLETLGEPPQIVDIEGYDDLPARVAFNKHNVKDQNDKVALDAATEEIYTDEFNKGILNDQCGEFAGKRIKVVKDDLRAGAVEADHGRLIRQFSEPVISRAGEVVDIKRIPDQSFIHYADEDWTEKAKAHAQSMDIYPQRYKDDITNVLDWFGDRACVRRGAWLGTEFPFKKDWIIEPIADSTFYSWYYLISLYVNDGRLPADQLTDAFFDYAINGIGAPESELWEQIRADIQHFGPVDINLGGKEHQTVHFPVYIMNNVGLLEDPAMNPRGLYVNWWVTQKAGAKISKSKGGAEPIPGAMERYGVDPMRLYYCHVGSPHVDIEWDADIVLAYKTRVERIARTTDDLLTLDGGTGPMDDWLEASMSNHLRAAKQNLEDFDLRSTVNELVYAVAETFRWYQHRGGANGELAQKLVRQWAVALCPLIPHTAEEMYERAGGEGLCSLQDYPEPAAPDVSVLVAEDYLRAVMEDIHTIAKLADVETPSELVLFTTPAWKAQLTAKAVEMAGGGKFPMGQFMGQVMADPEMRTLGKAVQKFTGKLPGELPKMASWQKTFLGANLDESAVLTDAAGFIGRELGAPVTVWAADAEDAPDHAKKAVAAPFKPGIHLE